MRPPTGNPITQGKHGKYNAVDYSSAPDPIIYAPEEMTFHTFLLNAGDAGNNLQTNGASGRHGFCHMEECYLKPGQTATKGMAIGKMGYTGLTIPSGPQGRHLHWVLLRNGVYVYPPDLITEPFGGGSPYEKYTKEELYKMFQDAERFKQAVVRSKAWSGDMNARTEKIQAVLDDLQQNKRDRQADIQKTTGTSELIKKLEELVAQYK